ncbi:hypothetical protein OsI_37835 [Oryza sativa Indica Group]|uniref:Uncharacterized protein n=1 Tax=Oryza sativa subsp. indica TaxID=39946 RepID=B8BNN8_ORYSI|nr:hypothetical protein OsI_37835 [Oryza sativa Indica Group]
MCSYIYGSLRLTTTCPNFAGGGEAGQERNLDPGTSGGGDGATPAESRGGWRRRKFCGRWWRSLGGPGRRGGEDGPRLATGARSPVSGERARGTSPASVGEEVWRQGEQMAQPVGGGGAEVLVVAVVTTSNVAAVEQIGSATTVAALET